MQIRVDTMIKKTLLLSMALLCFTVLLAQGDDKQAVDTYRKAKKDALPLIEEGTRARNKALLDSITLDIGESQEGSFEFHLVTYMNSAEKLRDAYHLQQAMALSPEDPDLIGEAIEYYGMIGDEASIEKMTTKLRKYGLYQLQDRYYKDFNSLMHNQDILFTNGESDTRPILMNRSASNLEYEIIRIAWLSDPLYLLELRSRGVMCPEVYTTPSEFIRSVFGANAYRRVLLSPTLNPELLSKFSDELMADGLGLAIGDHLPHDLKEDYEQIKSSLIDRETIRTSRIGLNYVPLLRAARLSFIEEGELSKADEIAGLLREILRTNGLDDLEEKILE